MTLSRGARPTFVGALLVAIAPGACTNAVSGVRLDVYPEAYAEVLCERLLTCCDASEIDSMFDGITDQASCEASLAAVARRSISDATASDQRYDTAAAGQCLDAIEALACADFATWRTTDSETRALCDAVFVGTRALAGACTDSDACEGTRVCVEGGCADPLAIGAECAGIEEGCARGSHCFEGRCRLPQPAGAPCGEHAECVSGRCESSACAAVIVSCDGP